MTAYIRKGGIWKPISQMNMRKSGLWKTITQGYIRVGGIWKLFFSGGNVPIVAQQVTISQSTGATGLITLTGRNYHWTNFSSASYKFQVSTDELLWTTIDAGSILNPATGSSNTTTYVIQQSNLEANKTNYFRFVVTTTSSSNTENSSESASTLVEMPRNITNLSASNIQRNQLDLSWTALNAGRVMLYYKYTSSGDEAYALYSGYSGSTTSATITGLNANRQYSFRILPWTGTSDNYGYYGNYSNVTSPTTLPGPVPTITNLTTSNITNASATVSWDSTNQIYWEISVPGVATYVGSSGTSYNITGLTANTTYNITVTVTADGGNTATASTSFTTLAAFIEPTAPAPSVTWSGTRSDGLTGQQWDWNSVTASGSGYVDGYQWYLSSTSSDAGFISNGFTTGTRLVTGSTATRYAKVRASIAGSDNNSYFGTWSSYVGSSGSTPPFFPPSFPFFPFFPYFAPVYNGNKCSYYDQGRGVCDIIGQCDVGQTGAQCVI